VALAVSDSVQFVLVLGNRPSASNERKAKKIKPEKGCVFDHVCESTTILMKDSQAEP
jgi:hypothetical protein